MSKSVIDISEVGSTLNKIIADLSIDGKRVVAKEMQNMATYKFPQAVMRFYPSVLRVRTGRLRQSFEGFAERASETGWRIGMRSRNVAYATAQHEGFDGIVKVKQHTRTLGKTQFGQKLSDLYDLSEGQRITEQVRAHTRHMKLPAKKFFSIPMKTEVDPMIKRIKDAIGFRP